MPVSDEKNKDFFRGFRRRLQRILFTELVASPENHNVSRFFCGKSRIIQQGCTSSVASKDGG
jgi:hypothetical protein